MRAYLGIGSVAAAIAAYIFAAIALFGSPWQPLALATLWHSRLGAPYWIAIGLTVASLSWAVVAASPAAWAKWKLPAFTVFAFGGSTAAIGLYVDHLRSEVFDEFGADRQFQHSFFRSIREAPREHQFYLHGAAIKDCLAYGWSYREMTFYRLPPGIAENVLLQDWSERCPVGLAS